MEQTVTLGEVNNIDSHGFNKITSVFHAKVEPLKAANTIAVVTHPNVECCCRSLPHLVDVCAFKIAIKHQCGFDCVQRNLIALSIKNVRCTTTSSSNLACIDRSFQIGPRLHHALFNGTAAPRRALPVLIVTIICIWHWPHQSLHSFDLVRILG